MSCCARWDSFLYLLLIGRIQADVIVLSTFVFPGHCATITQGFEPSPHAAKLLARVSAFMGKHVYPAEPILEARFSTLLLSLLTTHQCMSCLQDLLKHTRLADYVRAFWKG